MLLLPKNKSTLWPSINELFLLPKSDSSSPSVIRDKEICQSHVSTQWNLFLALLLSLLKSFIFWSFLKLNSHLKIFFVISNYCSASLPSVYLDGPGQHSLVKPAQRAVGKKSQNNTNN